MALTIGDNFSYQGAKPLDARLKYDTVAAMSGMADSVLYEGCLAYCTATDKTYQWKSGNTVDATLGKWREFETGSFDTTIIAPDYDSTATYEEGDRCVYEGVLYVCNTDIDTAEAFDSDHWDATDVDTEIPELMPEDDMSEIVTPLPSVMSRRFKYSTDEQVVGEWIDGKPLYQKTIRIDNPTNNARNQIGMDFINDYYMIHLGCFATEVSGYNIEPYYLETQNYFSICMGGDGTSVYLKYTTVTINISSIFITLQYTKTTD